jgi:cyclophilin family peptidyl-prolyl cis-trans isomerase
MKLFTILLFVFSIQIFAQYTPDDEPLAATTFTRNFDKVTEKEYLSSDNDEKVIAGLLSISHSEDTNFVAQIIKLPPSKFAREMCFALGQFGYCKTSIEFLQELLFKNDDPLINYYAMLALGKVSDSTEAMKIIYDYNEAESKSKFNGISLALYNLVNNKIIKVGTARNILESELYFSSSRKFEAAFSLYRVGPVPSEKELIVRIINKILNGKLLSPVTLKPLPYLLGCLRKLNYFPDDFQMLKRLLALNDFQTKIEAIITGILYNFKSQPQLDLLLQQLKSDNNNFSRSAASSLKNIKLSTELKDYLFLKMSELLHSDTELGQYTRGELFLSYLSLFPGTFNDVFIKFFNDKISNKYSYKVCALYPNSNEALRILVEKYPQEILPEKITILESILNFDKTNPEVKKIIFSAMNSDDAALITIAADGCDSTFIKDNKDSLIQIINNQINRHLNNADFIEAFMSLENLSNKISDSIDSSILARLSGSELYSMKKFVRTIQNQPTINLTKNIDDFSIYWKDAFKYKEAKIETDKGSFVISFFPEYAPITVGSFCALAEKKFFDGIPFHRVVPGFVIQGGDPTGTGWGGPGYEIISEFSPMDFDAGVVGMASAGKDTEGSQWFITTGNFPHLNGRYTIFAEVLSGMEVVNNISQNDKILDVELIR